MFQTSAKPKSLIPFFFLFSKQNDALFSAVQKLSAQLASSARPQKSLASSTNTLTAVAEIPSTSQSIQNLNYSGSLRKSGPAPPPPDRYSSLPRKLIVPTAAPVKKSPSKKNFKSTFATQLQSAFDRKKAAEEAKGDIELTPTNFPTCTPPAPPPTTLSKIDISAPFNYWGD